MSILCQKPFLPVDYSPTNGSHCNPCWIAQLSIRLPALSRLQSRKTGKGPSFVCSNEANTRFHPHQNTSSTNGIVSACRPPITPPQPHDVTPQAAIWCNHQSWSFILIINYKARMENGLGRNAVASFVRVHFEAFWKNRNVAILNKLSERIFRFKFYYLDF